MTRSAIPIDIGDEYTWLVETSDDGQAWSYELHPVHRDRDSGGIERATTAEDLAREVLTRRFALLRGDQDYDWDELWFRVIVWNHHAASDWAGWQRPPHPPEQAGQDPTSYGRYLQHHQAEPYTVEVRTPRQVRAAVRHTQPPGGVSTGTRAGAISRSELDQALQEITHLIDQAREAGWDSDPTSEHRALRTARGKLADLDQQLGDRIEDLEHQHNHRPGFTIDA